jgi:pimeloyl-ACP methyl ester carboxylesterase
VLVRAGALTPARALVKLVSRGGLQREDEGILAPIWKLPADTRRVLRYMWTQPKFFEALGSQIATVCESAAEVLRESPRDHGDLPLIVISASRSDAYRLQADAALARRSRRGQHVVADDSGHWVPLDAPQTVIDAIVSVVSQVRG